MNRNFTATGLSIIALFAALACSLKADDFAYMLGPTASGPTNPFGTVDLNSGAFTLIGSMGSGGYSGLAVANGVVYTEQNGLLYSVNTSNANLTLVGGLAGTNMASFGSTTAGLYGLAGTGLQNVATLFSINAQTGAVTAIGPVGVVGNGQFAYSRLSVGSSTLYLENNGTLYSINTTTGAGTQVGTTDTNGYLTSVLLFENGTYYVGTGSGIATINTTTGQITPHSSIFGGPASVTGLAPLSTSYSLPQVAFGDGWYTALYFTNTTAAAANIQVNFIGNDGNPLSVPLLNVGSVTSQTVSLNPGATTILEVPNSGALVTGWAEAALPSGVIGYAVFRQSVAGRADQEAVVPLTSEASQNADLVFDETGVYITGVGFLNPSNQQATVTITVKNAAGAQIGTSSVILAPRSKQAPALRSLPGLSGIVGQRGWANFSVSNGAVSVLGLRFGVNAFTSIPVTSR